MPATDENDLVDKAMYVSSTSWRGSWLPRLERLTASTSVPALATGLVALSVLESAVLAAIRGETVQYALVLCLLALGTTLPVSFRDQAWAAATVTASCVLSLAVFDTLTVAGFAAQLVVLFLLGRDGVPRRDGVPMAAVLLAAPWLLLALAGPRPFASVQAFVTLLLAAMAPAVAWAGVSQRAQREALLQRDARELAAGSLIEHTARGERARIARELHDVVAHHISMVAVQAETARLTTPGMPAVGAQRLSSIGDTARTALTEMRRLLGVLREDAQSDAADRRPQPGLRQLAELLDEARDASGTGTRLILRGPPVALDPGVELAAYRIAQEALTNARRHAPGAAVDVELHYAADVLCLRIRDNGPGANPQAAAGGHGLTGMRERAAAVGGELRTGQAPGGGFLVEASLPTRALG